MIDNLNELNRNEKLRIRKIDEKYYLLCGTNCFEVNDIGATIVNVIGKDMDIEVFCEKISHKYEFDNLEIIRKDAISFIEFLIQEGLVSYAQK